MQVLNRWCPFCVVTLDWGHECMIACLQEPDRKTWYPTIIGFGGDQECGQQARLYYSSMNQSFGDRKFIGRDIVFFKPGESGAQANLAWFPRDAGKTARQFSGAAGFQ